MSDQTRTVTDSRGPASLIDGRDATETMLDLAAPQPKYREMIAAGGIVEPAPGMALVFDRATMDHVLRTTRTSPPRPTWPSATFGP